MNKRGYIKLGKKTLWLVLALIIFFSIMFFLSQVSALKANQYFTGNNTCEQFTDNILWSDLAAVVSVSFTYDYSYNWSIGTPCQGTKNCDIISIWAYVRYTNLAAVIAPIGTSYMRLANSTESPVIANVGNWSNKRFLSYLRVQELNPSQPISVKE